MFTESCLCMQKPFKFSPIFDDILADIHTKDDTGLILLHDIDLSSGKRIYVNRLKHAGVDLDRVYFIPSQPHHRLMALYSLSDDVTVTWPR